MSNPIDVKRDGLLGRMLGTPPNPRVKAVKKKTKKRKAARPSAASPREGDAS